MECELIEDEVGGVAAGGGWIGGEREHARTVGESQLGLLDFGPVFAAGRVTDGVTKDRSGAVHLVHELQGLPFAGTEDYPVATGFDGVGHHLE